MDVSNIGEKIKNRRIELKITQKELASNMHVSNQLVSKWEKGESVPALNYIEKLCVALDISSNELIGETFKEPKPKMSKTDIKALIISGIVFVSLIFIVLITLLTYYVFVPYGCKDKYIKDIDTLIYSSVNTNKYYNLEFIGELDGDEKTNIKLQGYFDEDGNVCYYNSKTGETVKNNVKTKVGYGKRFYYKKPSDILNVENLFKNQLETIGEDENVTANIKDITYIRKVKNGYYLEFSNDFFTRDLTNTQKKNFKLTSKITGEVVSRDNMFKSLKVTIKYFDEPKNEHFTITSCANFIFEKPQIEQTIITGDVFVEAPQIEEKPTNFFKDLNINKLNKLDNINNIGKFYLGRIYTNSENICIRTSTEFIYLDMQCENIILRETIDYTNNNSTYTTYQTNNGYFYRLYSDGTLCKYDSAFSSANLIAKMTSACKFEEDETITREVNNLSFKIGENRYYDRETKTYKNFQPIICDGFLYNSLSEPNYKIKILEVLGDKILVAFTDSSDKINYFAYYSVDDLITPVKVIKVRGVNIIWKDNKPYRLIFYDAYKYGAYRGVYAVCFN